MANPSEPPDHYATLGIPPTASLPNIRRAYHAQALLHHPDRNRDQTAVATERFQQVRHVPPHSKRAINYHHHRHHTSTNPSALFQISLAWQTLSSTSSKRDYDLSRPSAPSSSSPPSDPPPPTPSPSSNPHTRLCLLRAQLAHLDALDAEHARARQLHAAAAAALPSWPWKWRPPAPATEEEEARLEGEGLERAAVRRVKLVEVEELERVVGREKEEEKGVREKEEEERKR
ncbi:DNAJ domain protein Psi [Lasiodiplodia theobromae]|uniref:DNAJ domain protein Psi n=1 Tax=Lasiodiplodia theobromae TaxID=45133 RepID=UPI0015C3DC45|nr:DNAJ domain protein Psi [Lasiodiplodia theobromae]KAF4541519.1 DNAJ domain protein Psi [Lasiodiplodia theobromae]